MGMRMLVVLAMCACGPIPPPCEENRVWCDDRCLTVCNHGEVVPVRCLPCGESGHFETAVNECNIQQTTCPADAGVPVWPS